MINNISLSDPNTQFQKWLYALSMKGQNKIDFPKKGDM